MKIRKVTNWIEEALNEPCKTRLGDKKETLVTDVIERAEDEVAEFQKTPEDIEKEREEKNKQVEKDLKPVVDLSNKTIIDSPDDKVQPFKNIEGTLIEEFSHARNKKELANIISVLESHGASKKQIYITRSKTEGFRYDISCNINESDGVNAESAELNENSLNDALKDKTVKWLDNEYIITGVAVDEDEGVNGILFYLKNGNTTKMVSASAVINNKLTSDDADVNRVFDAMKSVKTITTPKEEPKVEVQPEETKKTSAEQATEDFYAGNSGYFKSLKKRFMKNDYLTKDELEYYQTYVRLEKSAIEKRRRDLNFRDNTVSKTYPGDVDELLAWLRTAVSSIDVVTGDSGEQSTNDLVAELNDRDDTQYIAKPHSKQASEYKIYLRKDKMDSMPEEVREWKAYKNPGDKNAGSERKLLPVLMGNTLSSNDIVRDLLVNYGFNLGKNKYLKDEKKDSDADEVTEDMNENKIDYGKEAWMMNNILQSHNNEEAYYGDWLYIWPDGCSRDACEYYFGDEESYKELEDVFIATYKAYHDDGLYFQKPVLNSEDKEIIDKAHEWDKKLGLKPIEVLGNFKKDFETKQPEFKEATEEEVNDDDIIDDVEPVGNPYDPEDLPDEGMSQEEIDTLIDDAEDEVDENALEFYVKNWHEGDNITVTTDLLNVLGQALDMIKKFGNKKPEEEPIEDVDVEDKELVVAESVVTNDKSIDAIKDEVKPTDVIPQAEQKALAKGEVVYDADGKVVEGKLSEDVTQDANGNLFDEDFDDDAQSDLVSLTDGMNNYVSPNATSAPIVETPKAQPVVQQNVSQPITVQGASAQEALDRLVAEQEKQLQTTQPVAQTTVVNEAPQAQVITAPDGNTGPAPSYDDDGFVTIDEDVEEDGFVDGVALTAGMGFKKGE